jgi:DNA-binding response OmpR family regulator
MAIATTTPGKSILIVEDDADFTALLKSELVGKGYSVISANKVSDAITKINNQRFTFVLLDLKLEGLSGTRVLDVLRSPSAKESFNSETPVIVISGTLAPDVIRSTAKRVHAILAKPFKIEILVAKLDEILAAKLNQTTLAASPGSSRPAGNGALADFVHDISTAVATLVLTAEALREDLEARSDAQNELGALDVIDRSLKKIMDLIQSQRS